MLNFFGRHLLWWPLFVLLFSIPNYSAECRNDHTVCSYYCHKHQELGCDQKNYLSNFGYRYCRLFVDKEQSYSKHAQGVLASIRSCLVNHLAKKSNLTCDNAATIAVQSHVDCYKQNSFCSLSPKDQMTTLWYIKAGLHDPFFQTTMKLIVQQCRAHFSENIRFRK